MKKAVRFPNQGAPLARSASGNAQSDAERLARAKSNWGTNSSGWASGRPFTNKTVRATANSWYPESNATMKLIEIEKKLPDLIVARQVVTELMGGDPSVMSSKIETIREQNPILGAAIDAELAAWKGEGPDPFENVGARLSGPYKRENRAKIAKEATRTLHPEMNANETPKVKIVKVRKTSKGKIIADVCMGLVCVAIPIVLSAAAMMFFKGGKKSRTRTRKVRRS
jgi:hypothetical protein